MLGVVNILGFFVASAAVIFVPGPATFYAIGKAQKGVGIAILSVGGIVVGDIILVSLAGLGFAEVATRFPVLLDVMKLVGALYVGYLGYGFLKQDGTATPEIDGQNTFGDAFLKGLFLTLTNPKPILFFVAFFPLFIVPSDLPYIASFYFLGVLFQSVNLIYFGAIIVLSLWLSGMPFVKRFMAGGFNKFSGIILIFLAILVLWDAVAGFAV